MSHGDYGAQALIDHLGEEDATIIMEKLGGDNYRVPVLKDGTQYKRMKDLLGQELTDRFIEKFQGEEFYIPQNFKQKVQQKNNQVVKLYKELFKPDRPNKDILRQVASEMGMSVRHVSRILSKAYHSKL